MPEITRPFEGVADDPVAARVQDARSGLTELLAEAAEARQRRSEGALGRRSESAHEEVEHGGTAVCAWNHFENIPTFYNWNNRPR